jgi:chorismate-pyruvate lyase
VLRGRRSAQPYLYAETLLVPSRLPAQLCTKLEASSDPIGRILSEEGIAFTRAPLDWRNQRHASVLGDTATAPQVCLLARTYRLYVKGTASMVIAEWLLPALKPFLPAA